MIDPGGRMALYSRRESPLGDAFPELIGALYAELPKATAVDGEIVRWSAKGRLDFDAVQRRYQGRRRARELAEAEPIGRVGYSKRRNSRWYTRSPFAGSQLRVGAALLA